MLAALLAAGCQGADGPQRTPLPTRVPVTLTPRSTPLPTVANAPVLGIGERQIVIQITQFGENESAVARSAANALQRAITDETELDVRVEFVNETTALEAVCSGAPRAPWFSAFTLVKAQQLCDVVPVLALQRGRSPRTTVGQSADIISRVALGDIAQLRGLTFCRSAEQDYFTSWMYPHLLITAAGIDIENELTVMDYTDDMALGRALFRGDCNAAALPPGTFDDFLDDLARDLSSGEATISSSGLEDILHIVEPAGDIMFRSDEDTWQFDEHVIPYDVLAFPPAEIIPDDLRKDLVDIIEDFLQDRTEGDDRRDDLLDATGIMEVNADSYRDFSDLVTSAGWDMTLTELE